MKLWKKALIACAATVSFSALGTGIHAYAETIGSVPKKAPKGYDQNDPEWGKAYARNHGISIYSYSKNLNSVTAQSTVVPLSTYLQTKWGYNTYFHLRLNTNGKKLLKVVDVSKHNGYINWRKVRADGVTGAIIRVGYRGYGSTGSLAEDIRFKENIKNAKAAGIKVGVYIFSQALSEKEAVDEAKFAIKKLNGAKLDYPLIMDYEYNTESGGYGRLKPTVPSFSEKTNAVLAFCSYVKSHGYKPMVYASSSFFITEIDGPRIQKSYPLWVARYYSYYFKFGKDNPRSMYSGKALMWQNSSLGEVKGIANRCDINYYYQPTSKDVAPSKPSAPSKPAGSSLATPSGLKKTKASSTSISFKWNRVTGARSYQIYKKNNYTGSFQYVKSVKTEYASLSGLKEGDGQYIRVRAVKGGIVSKYSSTVYIGTEPNIAIYAKTKSNLSLRTKPGTDSGCITILKFGTKVRVHSKIKNGSVTWYQVTVSGKSGFVSSEYTKWCIPAAPSLKQKQLSSKAVTIVWKKVKNTSYYEVYGGTKKDGHFSLIGKTSKTEITDRRVSAKSTYYYKIRVVQKIFGSNTKGSFSKPTALRTK